MVIPNFVFFVVSGLMAFIGALVFKLSTVFFYFPYSEDTIYLASVIAFMGMWILFNQLGEMINGK